MRCFLADPDANAVVAGGTADSLGLVVQVQLTHGMAVWLHVGQRGGLKVSHHPCLLLCLHAGLCCALMHAMHDGTSNLIVQLDAVP